MAELTSCSVCSKQISNAAPACPHCGDPRTLTKGTAVTVKNVDMEFGTMISFMVKAAFASIPAAIIIVIVVAIATALLGGMFAGYRH